MTLGNVTVFGNVTLNWALLLGLVGAVIVDLIIRFVAFGHLESVAIDAALFTTAYSAGRWASLWGPDVTTSFTNWAIRTGVCGFILLALTAVHIVFRRKLDEQVRDLLSRLRPKSRTDAGYDQLEAAKKVVIRAVLLTFEYQSDDNVVRQGKLTWRKEVADLINTLAPKGAPTVQQKQFLLPRRQRLLLMFVFGVGLVVSLLSATLNF